jgi:hypothetical protein
MPREVTERDLRMPEFRHIDDLSKLEIRDDGKVVRKDRWEVTVRNIVSLLGWGRRDFECFEVRAEVEHRLNQPRTNWIEVEDHLPPDRSKVLMYSPDLRNPVRMLLGMYIDGKWMCAGEEMVNVTHWAERPALPEGEADPEAAGDEA